MVTATPLTLHPLNDNVKKSFLSSWRTASTKSGISHDDDNDTISIEPPNYYEVPLLPPPENTNKDEDEEYQEMRRRRQNRRCYHRFIRVISQMIATALLLATIVLIPYMTYRAVTEYDVNGDIATFYSSAGFVILAVLVSAREIYLHMTNWYMPDVQKYIVRILFMVPLYAVQSWFSLRFNNARLYIDNIRDFYEAFVVSAFVYLLIELLGGEEELAQTLRSKDAHYGQHSACFSWFFRSWRMGEEFMLECKWGVLQYVVMKTLTTTAIMILEPMGLYGEGSFDFDKAYIYLTILLNASVTWALYCLVLFFHAVNHELKEPKDWHPLGKFLCIKGVIFFTFWQGMVISILVALGIITEVGTWDADHVASALQNYLICFEMLGFAIAHRFTFSYKDCRRPNHISSSDIDDASQDDHPSSDVDYNSFVPPYSSIRTLNAPASVSTAFWSTTVPTETITDIKRLSQGTAVAIAKEQRIPAISMTTKDSAESI